MPIKSIREKKCLFIEATDSLTVEQSEDLLDSLKKAVSGPDKKISLDLSGVTESDISCLQLICSAHKSAEKKGKSIFINKISPELDRMAKDAGFPQHSDCSQEIGITCLWQTTGVSE